MRRLAAPRCSHQELYHATDEPITSFGYATDLGRRYTLGRQLGSGTFGVVFEAVDNESGERLAVKRMPKRFGADGSMERYYVRRIRNEVDICNHLGRSLNVGLTHSPPPPHPTYRMRQRRRQLTCAARPPLAGCLPLRRLRGRPER